MGWLLAFWMGCNHDDLGVREDPDGTGPATVDGYLVFEPAPATRTG